MLPYDTITINRVHKASAFELLCISFQSVYDFGAFQDRRPPKLKINTKPTPILLLFGTYYECRFHISCAKL